MQALIEFHIDFYDETTASIAVNPKSGGFPEGFLELFVFSTYVLRQAHNIGQKHLISVALGNTLSRVEKSRDALVLMVANPKLDIEHPAIELSTSVIRLVSRSRRKALKGFGGEVRRGGGAIQFILNLQGFNVLGLGINYYVPVSVGLLLNHLAMQPIANWFEVALSKAANQCGDIILHQEITMQNQMPLAQAISESLVA